MRVLLVHNEYLQKGGEDTVVANEIEMLKSNGNEVLLYQVSNKVIKSPIKKIKTFFDSTYSYSSRKNIKKTISKFKPDIIHVHNFFPLISASVYDAAHQCKTPIIQTLHNYRIICASGLLLRNGHICEKCIQGCFTHSIIHKCYRQSYIGSASIAVMNFFHKNRNTWNKRIDKIICLTEFAKNKFEQSGLDPAIIAVKPNFINKPILIESDFERENIGLFVGRLSHEKGIENLIKIHDEIEGRIYIVGDGPLLKKIKGFDKFIVLGRKTQQEVNEIMSKVSFLILPSIWYEGFPMTIVEAFSNKLPVISCKLGAMDEVIKDNYSGIHFPENNLGEMVKKINWAFSNFYEIRKMGENAYKEYNTKYTAVVNYELLMSIYKNAIKQNKDRR